MKDLHDKIALLTGASMGIGPYIAKRLRKEGVRLILSARSEDALHAVAREVGDTRIIVADLAKAADVERLAQEAGDIDLFISNAGIPASGRLDSFDVEEMDRAIAVNLRAGMVLARRFTPHMLERGSGHMVFVASIAAKVPSYGATVYNATKFGLRGFALGLREELHGTGVGVSVVCPTFVSDAGMWADTGMKAHPVAGEVSPVAVADAVVSCIKRNRPEIDVVPPQMKLSLGVLAVAPELVKAIARGSGAAAIGDEIGEKQRHKR